MILRLSLVLLGLCGCNGLSENQPEYRVAGASRLHEVALVPLVAHSLYRRQADNGTDAVPAVSSDPAAPSQDAVTPAPGAPATPADSGAPSTSAPQVASEAPATQSPPVQVYIKSIRSGKSEKASTAGAPATAAPTERDGPFFDPINPDDNVIHDDHQYYTSEVQRPQNFDWFWKDLETTNPHQTLSKGHRVAAVIPLKFPFQFYGHKIEKVTVATGGFIYMSPFLHQWLTATQYIAPLMANFDPSISDNSTIMYISGGAEFTVEWKNMVLQDQKNFGQYHFQATLFPNSSMMFSYKELPQPIADISDNKHPVKLGISDAYYNDTFVPKYNIKRRTIYEYHKVKINTTQITEGTVVYFHPKKTCNMLNSCDSCTRHQGVDFDCRWCNKIGRCSDGMDWYRQHWDKQCKDVQYSTAESCSGLAPPTSPIVDPHDTSMYDNLGCTGEGCNDRSKAATTTVVIVMVIVLVVVLIGAAGTWVYYAYTHPTSRSGMWLMEHRPSQMRAKIKFWKSNNESSAAKYQTETTA